MELLTIPYSKYVFELEIGCQVVELHGPRTLLSNLSCNTALVLQLEHWLDEFVC